MALALPFREAVDALMRKDIMPTAMSSAELRTLDADVRNHSFFSARTLLRDYLEEAKKTIESIINPGPDERGVNVGFNPATAREQLRNELKWLDYQPESPGTITDLASDARLNLVVKTNTELAQGAGQYVQQMDPETVELYPALELVRFDHVKNPRDWSLRWQLAAQLTGDVAALSVQARTGRMIALKSSPVWQALGEGAGGFHDTLGNPFPPFAFNSGMWTQDVDREEALQIGLIEPDQNVPLPRRDVGGLFEQ